MWHDRLYPEQGFVVDWLMLLFGGLKLKWLSRHDLIFKPKHCRIELGALSFWRPFMGARIHTQSLCLTYTQLKHLHHLSGNGNLMGSMVISTPESRSEHVVNDMRWNYADRIHSDKHRTFLEARKSLPIPRLPKYRGPKSRGSLSKRQCIWETSWDGWGCFRDHQGKPGHPTSSRRSLTITFT